MQGGASGAPAGVAAQIPKVAGGHVTEAPKAAPPAPPARYRVLNGGTIVWNNCRTPLRAGKEISSAHYDIALLRRQGIRLERIVDEDPAPVAEARQELAEPARQGAILVPGSPEARAAEEQWKREREAGAQPGVPTPQFQDTTPKS